MIGCMALAPATAGPRPAHDPTDAAALPGAIPANAAARLPSTAEQYQALKAEIAKSRPSVEDAKRISDSLKEQAEKLRQRLIDTAARVQALETEKLRLDDDVARLAREEQRLARNFSNERAEVTELLAVLERMQHDTPPAIAIRAGDAMAAAHSAMLLGATLPRLYSEAAELSRRLKLLQRTRAELADKRVEAARNASVLTAARGQLDQLLAMKARQADQAGARYDDLAAKLGVASEQAENLDALLHRVAQLRALPSPRNLVAMSAHATKLEGLLRPVVGRTEPGDGAPKGAPRAPGISFFAPAAAQVVAPADSQVLFAGPYHNSGQVLILQTANGYDLVLAGLERVDVRVGNEVLAGEPVGRMPRSGAEARLYFELRQNGKGINPMPWLGVGSGKVSKS
jgi:septal ring factor EnvC (AmiA/AmiB activator)